jgi:hypothetical protein
MNNYVLSDPLLQLFPFPSKEVCILWTSDSSNGTIIAQRDNIMRNHENSGKEKSNKRRKAGRIIPERKAKILKHKNKVHLPWPSK